MAQQKPTLALLTDMDGTLLNPDKTLSPRNAEAIAAFRENGGLFSIATGRGLEATLPYLELLQPDFPAVMYNGALVYDWKNRKTVAQTTLPAEAQAALAEILAFAPHIGAELLNTEGVFVVQDNEYEQKHLEITHVPAQYRTLAEMNVTHCFKALFAGAPEEVDRLAEFVKQPQFAAFSFTRSHSWFLEMLSPQVSKGAALSVIRQCLPAHTIIGAAGDFDNDIAMLQTADLCACPANAQTIVRETVSAAGGYVSSRDCSEDFFAHWIQWYLRHI